MRFVLSLFCFLSFSSLCFSVSNQETFLPIAQEILSQTNDELASKFALRKSSENNTIFGSNENGYILGLKLKSYRDLPQDAARKVIVAAAECLMKNMYDYCSKRCDFVDLLHKSSEHFPFPAALWYAPFINNIELEIGIFDFATSGTQEALKAQNSLSFIRLKNGAISYYATKKSAPCNYYQVHKESYAKAVSILKEQDEKDLKDKMGPKKARR